MEEALESISAKLMETGRLTKYIKEGNLAIVSLDIDGDAESYEIIINLTIDERKNDDLTDDEFGNITEEVQVYFESKDLWPLLEEHGWLEENCDGFNTNVHID